MADPVVPVTGLCVGGEKPILRIFGFLFYGFIAWASIYWVGGALVGDYQVASEVFHPAAEWRITKAECDTDYVIVSLCQLRFEHATGGVKDDATYVLMGSQRVPGAVAVVTGVASGKPSTSFGQERLFNRTATFSIYAGLLFWLVYINTRFGGAAEAGLSFARRQSRKRESDDAIAAVPKRAVRQRAALVPRHGVRPARVGRAVQPVQSRGLFR